MARIRGADRTRRFVPFAERNTDTALSRSYEFVHAIKSAKMGTNQKAGVHWRGVRNLKSPWELALYPMLLWELAPRTIIEIGAFEGGSASWLADTARSLGLRCRVYSFDWKLARVKAKRPGVTFLEADVREPTTIPERLLGRLPHPWLVIEDAHVNLVGVLEYLHRFMKRGDYLIVEDTLDERKHVELARFVLAHAATYRVDTAYVDNFGHNATWNVNGFLKRVR